MVHPLSPVLLLHLPHILSVVALAFRSQAKLRAVLVLAIALTGFEDLIPPEGPQWQSLFWDVVGFAINLVVLVRLLVDRVQIGMSAEERDLFDAFGLVSPGEFRALLRLASWHTAGEEVEITREGGRPPSLFYVLRGEIAVEKAGRRIAVEPRTFIGEIAFLQRRAASATVRLAPGTRYLAWPVANLDRQIQDRQALKHAVVRLISADMAKKVARS